MVAVVAPPVNCACVVCMHACHQLAGHLYMVVLSVNWTVRGHTDSTHRRNATIATAATGNRHTMVRWYPVHSLFVMH
jgi:hypothetical protein